MTLMTRQEYSGTVGGKPSENFREWLEEVDRCAISENRLELIMPEAWWQLLKALYHASYGVDDAIQFLASVKEKAVWFGPIVFRAGKGGKATRPPAKKSPKVIHEEKPTVEGGE